MKECEKKDKYLDFARQLKELWNMKVTIVPIVIGAFGTVTKGLFKGLEVLEVGGRVDPNYNIIENGQNTEKNPGDLRSCCHSGSSEKPSAKTDVKNSQWVNKNQ